MGIISDPIGTLKGQALKIWKTKDFAERLAHSRTTWFLHMMYAFMIITVVHTVVIISVNDLFTLYHFYYPTPFWLIDTVEEAWYSVHPIFELMIIYFFVSPIIVRSTLKVSRKYGDKEKALFDYIETIIKKRFPKYKTSAQRARERELNPRKKGKIKMKFDAFMERRNRVERIMIRGTIWISYIIFLGFTIIMMLGAVDDLVGIIFDVEPVEEVIEEEIVEEESEPMIKNDNSPPPTIFDIFISKPDTPIT